MKRGFLPSWFIGLRTPLLAVIGGFICFLLRMAILLAASTIRNKLMGSNNSQSGIEEIKIKIKHKKRAKRLWNLNYDVGIISENL